MSIHSKAAAVAAPRREMTTPDFAAESNHRIANSLALIASLLRSQASRLGASHDPIDPADAQQLLEDFSGRVEIVSRLHRLLADLSHDEQVDLATYLEEIAGRIVCSLSFPGQITLVVECGPGCEVAPPIALKLGLVVGEIVTNAVKYAHPSGVRGRIRLSCRRTTEARIEVEVADDGVGLPEGFDPMTSDSLGMRLVRMLSEEIGASFAFENTPLGLGLRLQLPAQR